MSTAAKRQLGSHVIFAVCMALMAAGNARSQTAIPGKFQQPTQVRSLADNSVSQHSGTMSSSIEIPVPAFHGIEPKLGLVYSSSAGNGPVGVGWRLEGFPIIERVSPGRGSPRFSQAISNDTFLLDGEELVPYTGLGGTHATKHQSFRRITKSSDSSTWTVTDTDGTITTFSRLFPQYIAGAAFRWGISQVRDTHGNTVNYTWACQTQSIRTIDCYPSTVSYGPHQISIYRTASRVDPVTFATGRQLGSTNYLLKSILVDTGGTHVRAFKMTYATSVRNGQSMLAAVQQFGSNVQISTTGASPGDISGGTSLPPTTFQTSETVSGLAAATTISGLYNVPLSTWQVSELTTDDFNGDGRADMILLARLMNGTTRVPKVLLLLANPAGGFMPAKDITTAGNMSMNLWVYSSIWKTGDFNGDGVADLLINCTQTPGGYVQVFRMLGSATGDFSPKVDMTTASGLTTNEWTFATSLDVMDVNSDGRGDLLLRAVQGTWNFNYVLEAAADGSFGVADSVTNDYGMTWDIWNSALSPADFNGDGRTDLLLINSTSYRAWLLLAKAEGGFTNVQEITTIHGLTGQQWVQSRIVPGDYNGDGRTDILMAPGSVDTFSNLILYANGADTLTYSGDIQLAFDAPVSVDASGGMTRAYWYNASIFPGDFNGDGRTDLFVRSAKSNTSQQDPTFLLFSNGNGFMPLQDITTFSGMSASLWVNADFRIADYDGDGDDDLFRHSFSGTGQYANLPQQIFSGLGEVSNLVTTINNGIGGATAITYAPSSKWLNSNNPPHTQTVLSTVTTIQNGRGSSTESAQYAYAGGKWDPLERRHLGFRTVRESDSSGAFTERTYYQSASYKAGEVEELTQFNSQGATMSKTRRTVPAPAGPAPWISLMSRQDDFEYNGDSSFRQSAKVLDYDVFGNVQVLMELGDIGSSGDERTTTIIRYPNTTSYIVSLPALESVYREGDNLLLAETRHYYDGGQLTAAPAKGDETATERFLDTTNSWVRNTASFDAFGNKVSEVDPELHTSSTTFPGSWGLFAETETNALGQTRSIGWDAVCGLPASTSDLNGQVTTYRYDELCRLKSESRPSGLVRTIQYNQYGTPASQHIAEFLSAGQEQQRRRLFFDGRGREWRRDDNIGVTVDTSYEGRGLVEWETAPYASGESPRFTSRMYDAMRRMTQEMTSDGATRLYHFGDWRVTRCDQLQKPMTQFRDAYGQVTTVREYEGVACGEAPACTVGSNCFDTQITYNLLGQRTKVVSAMGAVTSLTYDSLGRRVKEQDPDRGTILHAFDNDGNELSRTNADGNRRGTTYDALHRIKTKWIYQPAYVMATFNYDEPGHGFGVGRRTSSSAPTSSGSLYYDVMGNVITDRRTIGVYYPTEYTIGHQFDAFGRETSTTYPDGEVVTRTYDAAGRVQSIGNYLLSATYDARGNVKEKTLGNGVKETVTYDPDRFWVTGLEVKQGSSSLLSLTLQRNRRGEVTARSNSDPSMDDNWVYGYDDRRRLTSATNQTKSAWSKSFAYDGAGRMTSQSGFAPFTYPTAGVVPQNGPATISGIAVMYDARGNALTNFGGTASYDAYEDRVTELNGVRYYYDEDGERVDVTYSSSTHYFKNLYERNANSGVSTNYIVFNGSVLARKQAGVVSYYHGDQIGSIAGMTGAVGQLVLRKTYSPFGEVLQELGSVFDAFGVAGQRRDINGFYHMGAREMAPGIGIFISPDPSDEPNPLKPISLNRFAYADNSPVNMVDTTGFAAEKGFIEKFQDMLLSLSLDFNVRSESTANRSMMDSMERSRPTASPRERMLRERIASENIAHYDQTDPLFHRYTFTSTLCTVGPGCSVASMAKLVEPWSAPKLGPVVQGYNSLVFSQPIMHRSGFRQDGSFESVNITLKEHDFHAGAVVSTVFVDHGSVMLRTDGFGYNRNYGAWVANEAVGYAYFAAMLKATVVPAAKIQTGQTDVRALK